MSGKWEGEQGPGWYDITNVTAELQRNHHCFVEHVIRVTKDPAGRERLTVITVAYRAQIGDRVNFAGQKVTHWERRDYKTLPALLLNHLYILDANLTRAEEGAASETQDRLF